MASATATCMSKVNCSVARPESRCKCPRTAQRKILGGDECFELFFQKYAAVDEIGGVFDAIDVFRDPEQRLQIAQAPLASLTLGFDDIAQTLLAVPARRALPAWPR